MPDTPAGWPRPTRSYTPLSDDPDYPDAAGAPVMLPLPWITPDGAPVEWTSVREDSTVAHDRRLCQVCGEVLGAIIVLGATWVEQRRTHGPGMHPRCAALAFKFCPSFDPGDDVIVGWVYDGPGVGYISSPDDTDPYADGKRVHADARPITRAEAKKLARQDPAGTGATPARCPHRVEAVACPAAA